MDRVEGRYLACGADSLPPWTDASHSGWHAQAAGAGMFAKSALAMTALRLAMAPYAGRVAQVL